MRRKQERCWDNSREYKKRGCLKIEFSKNQPNKKVVKIRFLADFHDFI